VRRGGSVFVVVLVGALAGCGGAFLTDVLLAAFIVKLLLCVVRLAVGAVMLLFSVS